MPPAIADHEIPAIRLDQTMSVAASMISGLFKTFPEMPNTEPGMTSYICLAVFLHQLCMAAEFKDKVSTILQALIEELNHDLPC